jgi:mRNA-degrading endonuclease HigB of HigAB toxin-antitoxin module
MICGYFKKPLEIKKYFCAIVGSAYKKRKIVLQMSTNKEPI